MKISYDERYRQIAKWIIYYRKIKGLTQETLSAKVGISKSYLSKIEAPNSTKAYSLDVLFAIADALDIDVIRFFLPYEKSELHKLQFICDCSVIFAHNKKPL
ncbi:helix-turn-helix domain-containing protein [Anaerosinus massiliensis]|uniref:helix-turn-helix domain-containing protein n=1 Tax=Massilibacillus massiliensis TaxID=1806837 RepID=UPI000A7D4DD8|nr:helix-turn-helix transcriptional regulator [Massilibacillus massiliensis]